jgi:hypothetical protein
VLAGEPQFFNTEESYYAAIGAMDDETELFEGLIMEGGELANCVKRYLRRVYTGQTPTLPDTIREAINVAVLNILVIIAVLLHRHGRTITEACAANTAKLKQRMLEGKLHNGNLK